MALPSAAKISQIKGINNKDNIFLPILNHTQENFLDKELITFSVKLLVEKIYARVSHEP